MYEPCPGEEGQQNIDDFHMTAEQYAERVRAFRKVLDAEMAEKWWDVHSGGAWPVSAAYTMIDYASIEQRAMVLSGGQTFDGYTQMFSTGASFSTGMTARQPLSRRMPCDIAGTITLDEASASAFEQWFQPRQPHFTGPASAGKTTSYWPEHRVRNGEWVPARDFARAFREAGNRR